MPTNSESKWNAAIAVILKDEAKYLEEWLQFHFSIGFEHVFVFDNESSDEIRKLLSKYIVGGVVTYVYWPVKAGQIDAYNYTLKVFGKSCEWVCFIDVDEYVILHQHENIQSFLSKVEADEVLLPWRNYPYGGHKQAPGGTDIENYFWAYKGGQGTAVQVKHLVRPAAAISATAHFSWVNSNKIISADGATTGPTHILDNPNYKVAQINHYATRSYVENVQRLTKGQVDGGAEKQVAEFNVISSERSKALDYDDSALHHFGKFAIERSNWGKISTSAHRFGLMQKEQVLTSWNNVPYFFCKSFANYIIGEEKIGHGTTADLIQIDAYGRRRPIREFWTDPDLHSIEFLVEQESFLPYFMGSIHYGDFVRRFNFEACDVQRGINVDKTWVRSIEYDHGAVGLIFHIHSEVAWTLRATIGDMIIYEKAFPVGKFAGLIYYPSFLLQRSAVTLEVTDARLIQEVIFGIFP